MADEISVENVLRRCGDFGRYQLIHYIFLNLICIGTAINGFYYVFGVAEPSFRCRLPSNVWSNEDQYEFINDTHQLLVDTWVSSIPKCESINGSKCTDFIYDRSIFGRTFTEDSNFVCDNAVKRTWLSTAYQIGP
jgi:OCT family organic cation transporter-like MFS transporter 4/5